MNPTTHCFTTTTAASVATATTSSKLLKSELSYVPMTTAPGLLTTTAPIPMSIAPSTITSSGSSSLHIFPSMELNNASTTLVDVGVGLLPIINVDGFGPNVHTQAIMSSSVQNGPAVAETVPMKVIMTGGGGLTTVDGLASGTSLLSTGVAVIQPNAGSILIRHTQPELVSTTMARTQYCGGATLPILNQDLVKQIVVGNTPRATKTFQQQLMQQSAQQKLHCSQKKHLEQKTGGGIQNRQTNKTYADMYMSAIETDLTAKSKGKNLLSITGMATEARTYSKNSVERPIGSQKLHLTTTAGMELAEMLTSKKFPKQESQAKGSLNGQIVEKRESLLKTKPMQRIIDDNTSMRAVKRSKSLNYASAQADGDETGERRHSTASEGKLITAASSRKSPPLMDETAIKSSDKENEMVEVIILAEEDDFLDISPENTINELMRSADNDVEIAAKTDNQDQNNKKENGRPDQPKIKSEKLEKEQFANDEKQANPLASNPVIHLIKKAQKELKSPATNHAIELIAGDKSVELSSAVDPYDKSLLHCDEYVLPSSASTSACSSSNSINANSSSVSLPPQVKNNVTAPADQNSNSVNSLSSAVDILSNFNMLTWKERVGTARGTQLRFQLNEFNLLEVYERCPPRHRINTAYEKAIYDRESLPQKAEQGDPLLYLCRRCNCHGLAEDFLAPEFCSLECLKRNKRKRYCQPESIIQKRPRKDPSVVQNRLKLPQQQPIAAFDNSNSSIIVKKHFHWSSYLTGNQGAIAAPIDLFFNPFPTGPNNFQVGMKLEAIDPENCSLFCACTVVDIQGYRLKLTFDGYECMYDFWVNADSMDIFPPNWCTKTYRVLQPPKGRDAARFNWFAYLEKSKAIPAIRQFFTHLNSASVPTRNPFKIGMHLEAEDLNDTGKLCVATIADVLDDRIRVHFDGWDDCYDYWVDINSPYIHPCNWHIGRQQLIVPPEFNMNEFSWNDYISRVGGMATQEELFTSRDPIEFKPNMKLEVVDPRNPSVIRPASVVGRKGHRIKLHLDGWPSNYCFWLEDDSPDLHPIGWCDATGHDLEPPPGYQMLAIKSPCTTIGCRGIGNAKRFYSQTHSTRDCCPYAPENWRQKIQKPSRLGTAEIVYPCLKKTLDSTAAVRQQQQKITQNIGKSQGSDAVRPAQDVLNQMQILERIHILDNIDSRDIVLQGKLPSARVDFKSVSGAPTQQSTVNLTNDDDEESQTTTNSSATSKASSLNGDSTQSPQLEAGLHIAKRFLCDYGPRLQQSYNIWQKNFTFDANLIKQNPLLWSPAKTRSFVQGILNCPTTVAAFAREDIDGSALLLLQQSDLTDILGLKLGPAVKLYSCILQLRTLAVCKFNVKLNARVN